MKWIVRSKLPSINPSFSKRFDSLMKDVVKSVSKYFIQGLTSHDLIPAWTGQARASLTKAALLVGVTIDYSDIEEKNRKNKNVQTGIPQGSAKFFRDAKEYGFIFRSWVVDLNKKSKIQYLLENEYDYTDANRVRETPWHSLTEAGEETEKYIVSEIFPFLSKVLGSELLLKTTISVG